MPDIIRTYREQAPESRFIGICYGDQDRVEGGFARCWEDWLTNGCFEPLSALTTQAWRDAFPEADSYVGLMRMSDKEPFQYWIGLFLPPGTEVPEGYAHADFTAADLGVCLIRGKEPEIFWQCEASLQRMEEEGLTLKKDTQGTWWSMERYQCPRFTEPDGEGNKILDLVFFIEPLEEKPLPSEGIGYCAGCFAAFAGEACPECGKKGAAIQTDDPILIGELPGPLRNALQIAFQATEIPFTALPTKGLGFTMSAGDILETYMVYVPYERSGEALEAFRAVLNQWRKEGADEAGEAQP